jgi:hypothetical protein
MNKLQLETITQQKSYEEAKRWLNYTATVVDFIQLYANCSRPTAYRTLKETVDASAITTAFQQNVTADDFAMSIVRAALPLYEVVEMQSPSEAHLIN